jgi:endo-1,4-beta-xylanase
MLSPSSANTLGAGGLAHNLLVGSEFNYWHYDEAQYKNLWAKQYKVAVAEAVCKFGATEPSKDQFTLDNCQTQAARADDAGMQFRAHNLIWGGNSNPYWLLHGGYNQTDLEAIMKKHIIQVMQRLKSGLKNPKNVICWDVVNEALDGSVKDGWKLKTAAPWYPAIPDYVNQAFKYAAYADPDVLLFYNDYCISVSWDNGGKADAIVDMVKGMQKHHIKIDGIGMQMHLTTKSPPSKDHTSMIIKKFGALGLQVHITELDIACSTCGHDKTALQLQAQIYSD